MDPDFELMLTQVAAEVLAWATRQQPAPDLKVEPTGEGPMGLFVTVEDLELAVEATKKRVQQAVAAKIAEVSPMLASFIAATEAPA